MPLPVHAVFFGSMRADETQYNSIVLDRTSGITPTTLDQLKVEIDGCGLAPRINCQQITAISPCKGKGGQGPIERWFTPLHV